MRWQVTPKAVLPGVLTADAVACIMKFYFLDPPASPAFILISSIACFKSSPAWESLPWSHSSGRCCPWTSGILLLRSSVVDHRFSRTNSSPQIFGLWTWAKTHSINVLVYLAFSLGLDYTTGVILVLQFAKIGLWDFTASIIMWASFCSRPSPFYTYMWRIYICVQIHIIINSFSMVSLY